jgi:hypothetical protein
MSLISNPAGAAAALALSALVSMGAQAQNEPDAMRIVKDATTGELRAPTAEEHKAHAEKREADAAKGGARRAARADAPHNHVNHRATGIRGARMIDNSTMSEAKVVLQPDGTLHEFCSDPSHNHGAPAVGVNFKALTKATKLETE